MVSAQSLMIALWKTLDGDVIRGTAFEPKTDDRLPPRAVRTHLFPTWLDLGDAGRIDREVRRAVVRASGVLGESEADFVRDWFAAARERIHRDCEWHAIILDEYYRLRGAERAGDSTIAVPHFEEAPTAVFQIVRDFGGGPFDPRDDHDEARGVARRELATRAGAHRHGADAAGLRRELREHRGRYEALLARAWETPAINTRPTATRDVDALLAGIAAGLGHTVAGGFRGVVADDERGEAARSAWATLLEKAAEVGAYAAPHRLWLTRTARIAPPALESDGSRAVGEESAPLRLDQAVLPRITTLLRPERLRVGADVALAHAIPSTAQQYGLGATASRAALLLAYHCRLALEVVIPPELLDPAGLAVRAAFRRSGAVGLAIIQDPRAEKVMTILTSTDAFPARTWLGRVWGGLWRHELNGEAVESLDDAWKVLVTAAYSTGKELSRRVVPPAGPGDGEAESAESPIDPRVTRAVLTVVESWDDADARLELGTHVRGYSLPELLAIRTGLDEPLPASIEHDRELWAQATRAFAAAHPAERDLLDLATFEAFVHLMTRVRRQEPS